MEVKLRAGQAEEALEKLREALGLRSLLLRTKVRNAKFKVRKTRAYAEVSRVSAKIAKHLATYNRARKALIHLLPQEDPQLSRFQVIQQSDLRLPGDIVDENRVGQKSDTLAWFWKMKDQQTNEWKQEGMQLQYIKSNS